MKKLTIELVPSTCWFSNVRSEVTKDAWEKVKKQVFSRAGYVCEVCGGKGPKWPVECHEVWEYNDHNRTQTLVGMTALCPDCHEVKHIGLAKTRGRLPQAAAHLAEVNQWDPDATIRYIQDAFRIWAERSQYQWKLDISLLDRYGVTPRRMSR